MVQDSKNYGVQYKDGALRETPLAAVFSQICDVNGMNIAMQEFTHYANKYWTGL